MFFLPSLSSVLPSLLREPHQSGTVTSQRDRALWE
jgi:hypothetical protein